MDTINIRKVVTQAIFIVSSVILLIKLFFMQVMDTSYEARAQNNVVEEKIIYPSRGLIVDRNNKLVVNNEAVYDLVVTPRLAKDLDTLKLCELLNITQADFDAAVKKMKKSRGYSYYKQQVLYKNLSAIDHARLQEYLYQFQGFDTQRRTIRSYPYRSAAHVLGYIGEVNQRQIDTSDYYLLGDYIGISGIERTYEERLRGKRGIKKIFRDVHNREIDSYKGGSEDKEAESGQTLHLTLDIILQNYAEQLLQNKKGAVVAIEPKTGEILTFVSAPTYDPNILTGRYRGNGMKYLQRDSLRPLFNRALESPYPPGSTFKPLMSLLALQEDVIDANYYYGCYGGYRLGRLTVGCHGHASCYGVEAAVQHSCNAYFCHIFKLFIEQDQYNNVADGLTAWHNYLNEFGLGIDIKHDISTRRKKGYAPKPDLYNRMYGEKRWRASMIISLGIGQGELGVTPVQLAHMTAIIANKGTYYYPHVVRPLRQDAANFYLQPQKVNIDQDHFDVVVDGMRLVVTSGTARVAEVPDLDICGKTGTAENPHGKDHSLFIAFAPKDDPKIALGVMVENGGFGSTYAAPIASLLIEQYLTGSISEPRKYLEERILNADLIGAKAKPKPKLSDTGQP